MTPDQRRACTKRSNDARTPTYITWMSMVQRCTNPRNTSYARYGGRGVRVCERWRVFANFLADMGERPDGRTIDRIDSTGNYEPGNCRWSSVVEQQNNIHTNHMITANGETRSVSRWAALLGLRPQTLTARLARGWTPEAAVTTPRTRRAA